MRYILSSNYLSQAFALKSLKLLDYEAYIKVEKINYQDIPNDCISYLGHENDAYFLSKILGQNLSWGRDGICFTNGDIVYITALKNAQNKPKKGKDDLKTIEEMSDFYDYMKITIAGFEGIIANIKQDRIRLASNYLSYTFTVKSLKLTNYNAYLKVNRVTKFDIPSDVITCIKNPNQANYLTKELGFKIKKGAKTFYITDNDVLYVATTDYDRLGDGTGFLKEEDYEGHTIYLKVTMKGFKVN